MKTFGSSLIEDVVGYHVDNKIPLYENQMRPFSDSYFQLFREVRNLWREGKYQTEDAFEIELLESDIGEVLVIDGKKTPLDHIMEEPDKDVELNKPKAGGAKKYYVYVKNDKGNVVKVQWGDTSGLKVKLNDPAARKSFAARHKCDQANDKTTASYWACRMPRFGKSLGLKVDSPGSFW